ncbi:hypothetical protein GH733_011347 [Mirounga leonina]|nr:hypothetical protein GH733_011347 [Mirounga leonina]
MGGDIHCNRDRKFWRKEPKSEDIYQGYLWLDKPALPSTSFAEEVVHELHQLVASVPFLDAQEDEACFQEDKTTVLVGTVMDDVRVPEVSKVKARDSHKGSGTILFSDPRKGPEVSRHFSKAL